MSAGAAARAADREGFAITYVASLDGFRVLAIVPVLLIHAGAPFMPGGALGVDLFFTLSGFLITSLLLRDLAEHGKVALSRFWLRRAARLVPALAVVVVAVVAASFLVPGLPDPAAMRWEALAAIFYVTNWTRVLGLTGDALLNHTWSLGIEEQYYLLWPLGLSLLARAFPDRRRLAGAIGGIACAFAMWRTTLFQLGSSNDRLYNGLDTRADSLLIGSALAVLLSTGAYAWIVARRRWTRRLVWIAIAVLSSLAVRVGCHDPFMYRFGYFLVPCCVALVLTALVADDDTFWLRRVLATAPFVWVGRVSYGIYLWHVPVFRLMVFFGLHGRWLITVGTALSTALAALSYYTIEAYFRRRKPA